ncbi:YheV family putative metal-binding protein [Leptolyngbya sp. Heron Island J]|uniref:YheV family putative metal-binding protein n=1 Tax=Leptolyngbya sp. Heron Island J TaxID=1385935 RepID=UPI000426845E|nr:YheV family putative metal-binding protein [Leptolyngbya sp. Heron Island J]
MLSHESGLVCPKCQKQGLVRLEHRGDNKDIFECVYCHHEEDLSKPAARNFSGFVFTALIAVLITLLMLGV